jgi:RNA polymerase sigma-70 factor (ECF subfamily)
VEPAVPEQVTELLIRWSNGDRAALDKLTPLVYDELRRVASHYMRREDTGHTLQTTALVNETYLRLIDQKRMRWQNRAHFFGIAAQLMRRILVDHARKRHNLKRGGTVRKVSLDQAAFVGDERDTDLVALDEALRSLETLDERKGKVVELRFFGGLNIEEAAEVLSVSPATIQREWAMAKAWLYREITERQ